MVWLLGIIAMNVIAKSNSKNQLHNDTCASIKMNNISANIAEIVCDKDSKIFDPANQHGVFIFDSITGSWNKSEIFSCQCKCHLKKILENGSILPESIPHGATFEYKCNEGFSQKINGKVTCYDGIMLLIPDYLADYNITIAFRQKSLDGWFTDDFKGEIFPLSVNKTSNWTVPVTEVHNQKYMQSLSQNETVLVFYLFNGQGFKHGIVSLKTGLKPECIKTDVIRSAGTIVDIVYWYLFFSICIYRLF